LTDRAFCAYFSSKDDPVANIVADQLRSQALLSGTGPDSPRT
jgi:hypothetical protein